MCWGSGEGEENTECVGGGGVGIGEDEENAGYVIEEGGRVGE